MRLPCRRKLDEAEALAEPSRTVLDNLDFLNPAVRLKEPLQFLFVDARRQVPDVQVGVVVFVAAGGSTATRERGGPAKREGTRKGPINKREMEGQWKLLRGKRTKCVFQLGEGSGRETSRNWKSAPWMFNKSSSFFLQQILFLLEEDFVKIHGALFQFLLPSWSIFQRP